MFLLIIGLFFSFTMHSMEKTATLPSADDLYTKLTKVLNSSGDRESILRNYQIALNLLYAHSEWVKSLSIIIPIIEEMDKIQIYRCQKDLDGNPHFVGMVAFAETKNEAGYSKKKSGSFTDILTGRKRENVPQSSNDLIYRISTPEAKAILLYVFGQVFKPLPLEILEPYLKRANYFLSLHINEEVTTIANIVKTRILEGICIRYMKKVPSVMTAVENNISNPVLLNNIFTQLPPTIYTIYSGGSRLCAEWVVTSEGYQGYAFVTEKLKKYMQIVQQACLDFIPMQPIIQTLYEKLYKDLSENIQSTGRNRIHYYSYKKVLTTAFFMLRYKNDEIASFLPTTITYTTLTPPIPPSEIVPLQKKQAQKNIPAKKQKKRKRRKKKSQSTQQSQKMGTSEPEETSSLTPSLEQMKLQEKTPLPTNIEQTPQPTAHLQLTHSYDERVLQWLDPNYQELHPLGVLYHTAPLILEKYIFANNIPSKYENISHPGQVDTSYQSAGEIIYSDGKRETVVFTLTFDPTNVCYHVGTDHFSGDEIFAEYSAFHYWKIKPPSPENAPAKIEKPTPQQRGSISYIIEKEDEFHVRIRDLTNNVTLILYKKLSF